MWLSRWKEIKEKYEDEMYNARRFYNYLFNVLFGGTKMKRINQMWLLFWVMFIKNH